MLSFFISLIYILPYHLPYFLTKLLSIHKHSNASLHICLVQSTLPLAAASALEALLSSFQSSWTPLELLNSHPLSELKSVMTLMNKSHVHLTDEW